MRLPIVRFKPISSPCGSWRTLCLVLWLLTRSVARSQSSFIFHINPYFPYLSFGPFTAIASGVRLICVASVSINGRESFESPPMSGENRRPSLSVSRTWTPQSASPNPSTHAPPRHNNDALTRSYAHLSVSSALPMTFSHSFVRPSTQTRGDAYMLGVGKHTPTVEPQRAVEPCVSLVYETVKHGALRVVWLIIGLESIKDPKFRCRWVSTLRVLLVLRKKKPSRASFVLCLRHIITFLARSNILGECHLAAVNEILLAVSPFPQINSLFFLPLVRPFAKCLL